MNRSMRTVITTIGLVLSLTASPLAAQEIIDILLKNGHVIDPHNERNGRFDIAIIGNKIHKVGKNLPCVAREEGDRPQ